MEQGSCYGSYYMEQADKGWTMITIGEWVNVVWYQLPISPRQRVVKRLLLFQDMGTYLTKLRGYVTILWLSIMHGLVSASLNFND